MGHKNRKAWKKNGRKVLKTHYLAIVLLLVISSYLGSFYGEQKSVISYNANGHFEVHSSALLKSLAEGDMAGVSKAASGNLEELSNKDTKLGGLEVGHKNGIFADVVNKFASGSVIASIASTVNNITGSSSETGAIMIILAEIIIILEGIFVADIFNVAVVRYLLACRTYKKVGVGTLTFLIRTKTWFKASLRYYWYHIVLTLWWFTIIGGLINSYAYAMVKYILAENPNVTARQAMKLSRQMMRGHKWELFVLDLSFIGWNILSVFTGGLLKMFFLEPYVELTKTEYYVYLRNLAKEQKLENVELLYDNYLYERAHTSKINEAYKDIIEIMEQPEIEIKQPNKFRAFMQDVFGVVLRYDAEEMEYRKMTSQKARVNAYKNIIKGDAYPELLCPTKTVKEHRRTSHLDYMRHYSVASLIIIFFSFCLVGWLWEVSIHIVKDGVFVNRGVMHGPWLPIYGTGAVMILIILNKLRKNPLVEFISAMILCGAVEYSGSFLLEKIHGKKWWDYSGYFLNINGRICAEGLTVFGLAGIAAVYFLAPMIDNNIQKIKEGILYTICVILVILFGSDLVYSHYVPNTGKGITDYGDDTESVSLPNIMI